MYTTNHYPSDDRTVVLSADHAWDTRLPLTDPMERQPLPASSTADSSWLPGAPQPNVLLTAAAPLLSELVRIRNSNTEPEPTDILRVTLEAGVQQFDQQCRALALTPANRQVARYLLCTALDEAILTTRWGTDSDWSNRSLLSAFHQETFGGEKFFLLLTRLSQDTARHIDILELMLVCLSLGFEGRYRLQMRGHIELERIRTRLHSELQRYRATPDMEFAQNCCQPERNDVKRPPPRWLIAAATAGCVASLFLAFNYHLEQRRDIALQPYLSSSGIQVATPGAVQ